ncbi:hypothetical protein L0F63_003491, partial [Massospora cicadina]
QDGKAISNRSLGGGAQHSQVLSMRPQAGTFQLCWTIRPSHSSFGKSAFLVRMGIPSPTGAWEGAQHSHMLGVRPCASWADSGSPVLIHPFHLTFPLRGLEFIWANLTEAQGNSPQEALIMAAFLCGAPLWEKALL